VRQISAGPGVGQSGLLFKFRCGAGRFTISRGKTMTEVKQEKDNFVLYVVLATAVVVGAILAVKMSENEKFAPIKDQIAEENRLMNIRVIGNRED
jgi:hypothetical protein